MRKRAMTLIELIIYMSLFILTSFALLQLYLLGNSTQRTTVSNYILSGDTETMIRTLRNDLQRTALPSIRTYGNTTSSNEAPGCSMASDLTPGNETANVLPSTGKPAWVSHVFYTLVNKDTMEGEIVRWEEPIASPDNLPHPTTTMPSSLSTSFKHTYLRQVLLRNVSVKGLSGKPSYATDMYAGFRVQYVQRQGGETGSEVLSDVNPGDPSTPQPITDTTKLVEVELKILTSDETSSKPSFYDVTFRVYCEH